MLTNTFYLYEEFLIIDILEEKGNFRIRELTIAVLIYVHDEVLVADDENELQFMANRLVEVERKCGSEINMIKMLR